MTEPGLEVTLQSPLPVALPAGCVTALFCSGTCFHPRERVEGAELVVAGGERRPVAALGMPRPDVLRARGEPAAFRSGWWGTVPVRADGPVALSLAVRLAKHGGVHEVPLATVPVRPGDAAPRAAGDGSGRIAVCMATYEPDPRLFRLQVESLRAQTDADWTCVISDDASSRESFAAIEAEVAGDQRFVVARSEERRGFYRNFERALRLAPPEVGLLALCDQDDRWHPDKLAALRAGLGSAGMVYSDLRLVDAHGAVLRPTLWNGRRNNHRDLASLLVANSVTGAAILLRREIAELALPFPDTPGLQFHDHWLALVALAAGEVAYVDRPLYDYVQHSGAVFGEVSGSREPVRRRAALGSLLRGGRGAYFLGYLARVVQAEVVVARCAGRLAPAKRRALRRFIAAEHRPLAFAWLALRPLRRLAGRTETLGSEAELAHGVAWRWAVDVAARLPGAARLPWVDAGFPDPLAFEQRRLRRWRARA